MNILNPIECEADERSKAIIDRIVEEAGGDQYALLALLDAGLQASKRHQDRLKERRLEVVKEMRNAGVPMVEIAEAANVNDSYLARLLIAAGEPRKVDRTRPRRRRRHIPPQGRTA